MRDVSPVSPEERRKHPEAHPHGVGWRGRLGPGSKGFEFVRRVVAGVYAEGFIHAGNLAYLTLLAIFPFFILVSAFATMIGRPEDFAAVKPLISALPPAVAALIESTANQVVNARTGPLLWLGAAVGFWTVGSFIETIREILRRAYGTDYARPFWQYRLIGFALIFGAVSLLMLAFSAQFLLTALEEIIARFIPAAHEAAQTLSNSRLIPALVTWVSSYCMFWTLAPAKYRSWRYPKWPGALFTTLWWSIWFWALPNILGLFGGYTLTYGGLAGVMVALLFFWLIGYGLVIGANINAALVNVDRRRASDIPVLDELTEAKWLDS